MNQMLAQILMQVGLMLLVRRVNSGEDTTALEAEIAAADRDKVEEIAIREGLAYLGDVAGEDVGGIATELAAADNSEDVVAVIAKPENKLNILQGLTNIIGGLLKALFGGN